MLLKFQMKHLLLAKGLWGLVDCSEALEGDAAAERTAQFRLKPQKAFSTITQLYYFSHYACEDPKQTWDTLRNYFERETLGNNLFLKNQYFQTEMKEGTFMEQHLKHMKDITDRLATIGAPISEEDQVDRL